MLQIADRRRRILEPEKKPAPNHCTDGRGCYDGPPETIVNRITAAPAKPQIQAEANQIRERLEEDVRMDRPRADGDEDRKSHARREPL